MLYASQNGLSLLNETGVIPSTQDIITKDEWLNDYSPNTLKAAQYEDQWLGFYTENKGISINPGDDQEAFIEFDSFNRVDMIQTDERTGEVYVLRSGAVYLWGRFYARASSLPMEVQRILFPKALQSRCRSD